MTDHHAFKTFGGRVKKEKILNKGAPSALYMIEARRKKKKRFQNQYGDFESI